MRRKAPTGAKYVFLLASSLAIPSTVFSTVADHPAGAASADVHWLFRLIPILTGYGVLILLGSLFIRWVQRREKENELNFRRNFFARFFRLFALGRPEYRLGLAGAESAELQQQQSEQLISGNEQAVDAPTTAVKSMRKKGERPGTGFLEDCLFLSCYFIGIQTCLVCIGFFQERIVTRGYLPRGADPGSGTREFFNDAQFLVFANRLVAFLLSGSYLLITWRRQPVHVPPLYLHSFASLSNVISSWCQYEALKYVSFPTQTVCKASKIVPTMLMGKLLRHQRYSANEYLLALILVLGASLFFLSMSAPPSADDQLNLAVSSSNVTQLPPQLIQTHSGSTLSGLMLMSGYLLFDAFTPNWQKKLFDQPPRISTSQMMFAVNAFSVFLCLLSLLHQWTLVSSLHFLLSHESILSDCLFLSLGSAFGQVFIYLTIKRFGPVVLSVLMTIRQILSIILSSIYFVHPINLRGIIGLLLVFNAIFFDIYSKYRLRRRRR